MYEGIRLHSEGISDHSLMTYATAAAVLVSDHHRKEAPTNSVFLCIKKNACNRLLLYQIDSKVLSRPGLLCVQGGTLHGPGDEASQHRRPLQVGGPHPLGRDERHGWNRPHAGSAGLRPPREPAGLHQTAAHGVSLQPLTGEFATEMSRGGTDVHPKIPFWTVLPFAHFIFLHICIVYIKSIFVHFLINGPIFCKTLPVFPDNNMRFCQWTPKNWEEALLEIRHTPPARCWLH